MTLIWRPGYITTFADPDVQSYLTRVEEADNQGLEYPVAVAIDEFIRGCKADGIWSAIKASCIMAGARTLAGALVPLVGPAPTNFNFVAGDYNRKTGLVGNGSTKYLDSGRNNNADPQNSKHLSVYGNAFTSGGLIGSSPSATAASFILAQFQNYRVNTGNSVSASPNYPSAGFIGISRNSSTLSSRRYSGVTYVDSSDSSVPSNATIDVFRAATNAAPPTNARLAFYSIGESLNLALLDARITTLINRFAVVIP
jgi:hypothetical protein